MTLLKSNRDLISEEQVMVTAKLYLGLDDTTWDMFFKIALQNMLRKLKSPSTVEVRRYTSELCNRAFKLPNGFQQLLGICLPNQEETCEDEEEDGYDTQFIPRLLLYTPLVGSLGVSCACFEDYIQIENGYIYLNAEDQEMSITYFGYHIDDQGNIMLYDTYEDLLVNGLCNEFLLANPTYYNNDVYQTKSVRQEYYAKYIAAKNGLRGAEQRQQFLNERAQISAVMSRVNISNYEAYFSGFAGGPVN